MGTKVRGQKVATATVSEAHVHATLGEYILSTFIVTSVKQGISLLLYEISASVFWSFSVFPS